MQWIGSIFIYIVVWWVVLFAVLPWGVRRQENPGAGPRSRRAGGAAL